LVDRIAHDAIERLVVQKVIDDHTSEQTEPPADFGFHDLPKPASNFVPCFHRIAELMQSGAQMLCNHPDCGFFLGLFEILATRNRCDFHFQVEFCDLIGDGLDIEEMSGNHSREGLNEPLALFRQQSWRQRQLEAKEM
jgi:hypothetical protein